MHLVLCVDAEGGLGREGVIPWKDQRDMKYFKRVTSQDPGSVVLMGRTTYKSIGRPLVGRLSCVLTRQTDFDPGHDQVDVRRSLSDAIEAHSTSPLYVIGGASVYAQCWEDHRHMIETVHVTRLEKSYGCDVHFMLNDQELSSSGFVRVSSESSDLGVIEKWAHQ